jgi:UDP-2,3-diacylglucosamine pyrophosphatase LpxH
VNYRSIWLSDLHLGTRSSNDKKILDFLRNTDSEYLYLNGDIIDGWRLKWRWYWPQTHNDIIQKILRKARKGTQVFYIPGNHDEFLRDYIGHSFGRMQIVDSICHKTFDGRRFLVIHGDIFDFVTMNYRWLAVLGDFLYDILVHIHNVNCWVRRKLGLGYWSIAHTIKRRVKKAVIIIGKFEELAAEASKRSNFDGVICGHIHHAEIKKIQTITYFNIGDGVESCTALVETVDGEFQIVDYNTAALTVLAAEKFGTITSRK